LFTFDISEIHSRTWATGVFDVFVRPLDAVLAIIEAQRDLRAAVWGPTGRLP
jgi:hypothetical protein